METPTPEEARALAGTYRLLGRLWMREVDSAFLSELQRSPVRESFEAAGGFVPIENTAETLEELAVDYCQLLIGPKDHVPPYQSVWISGQLQGESTSSMSQFIDVVGYDLSRVPEGVLLDHFAVQLDVMGHILQQFDLQPTLSDDLVEIATAFTAAHLSWVPSLLEAASTKATSDFYRSAAALTREFISC